MLSKKLEPTSHVIPVDATHYAPSCDPTPSNARLHCKYPRGNLTTGYFCTKQLGQHGGCQRHLPQPFGRSLRISFLLMALYFARAFSRLEAGLTLAFAAALALALALALACALPCSSSASMRAAGRFIGLLVFSAPRFSLLRSSHACSICNACFSGSIGDTAPGPPAPGLSVGPAKGGAETVGDGEVLAGEVGGGLAVGAARRRRDCSGRSTASTAGSLVVLQRHLWPLLAT